MVFKKDVVVERLSFLQETLKELKSLRLNPKEKFSKDTILKWAVEHGLHLAAESVFDIGNHILVGHFAQRAVGYDLVLNELANMGVVSSKLAKRFEKMGGFRNVLVHEYTRIDFDKVYERLQNGLSDFEALITELISWLKKTKIN